MNPKILFGKIVWILPIFIIALAILSLLAEQRLYAEAATTNNSSSATNSSLFLEKRTYQSVKDLEYSDQVAQDFVKMVRPWKCEILYQKLCQAAQDVKQKKITWPQYAQVEHEIVDRLVQTIKSVITDDKKMECFDLALIIKEKKAQCTGYSQLFYILGNSLGLTVQGIEVEEHSEVQKYAEYHIACAVGLHNGKAMQVDLTLDNYVSKEFVFLKEYEKAGYYWNLRDKNNHLNIHPRIQLLNRKGLIASICNNRGIAYTKSSKLSEAFSEFAKAIELDTECAWIYNNRAHVYTISGKLSEATVDCNKAIELNPEFAKAYYNRGTIFAKAGKLSEAISDLNKVIELNPKYAEAYCNRGSAYTNLGKLTEALSDYNKAIELNPKYIEAYCNRGTIYGALGKLSESISDFNKAIELNPKNAEAYCGRGVSYVFLGKKEDAKRDFRKALQLNPNLKDKVKVTTDQFNLAL